MEKKSNPFFVFEVGLHSDHAVWSLLPLVDYFFCMQ